MDILTCYPGQSKILQVLNPDSTVFVIPQGSTVTARAIDVLGGVVCDLSPAILDPSKGYIRLTVPDTPLVRSNFNRPCHYDAVISTPTQSGITSKFIPASRLKIVISPSMVN
jgi:hypothetical protein